MSFDERAQFEKDIRYDHPSAKADAVCHHVRRRKAKLAHRPAMGLLAFVLLLSGYPAMGLDRPAEPRYTPPEGTYPTGQKITLSSTTPDTVIRYTVDGSQVSANSTEYTAPLVLTKGEIIRAIAIAGSVSSYEASATFAVAPRPVEPRYTPPEGTYQIGQQVTLSSSTPNTVIHYTLDGSQVSMNSTVYTAPLVLTKGEIVRAIAVAGSVSSYQASATFNVTSSSSSSIPASLFGLNVLDFTMLSPSTPFGTTRSWDAWPNLDWSDANPSIGSYDFTYLDKFMAINQARGAEMIYTFGRTPRWASSKPNAPGTYGLGECAPPADMSYWQDYVTAIATHAAGRIKYWELWNEPQGPGPGMYCGDMSSMITMARYASQIIKGIDPTALILSPGVTGGPGPAWLSSFLSEGGGAYVDVIAFHGYWSAEAEGVVNVISSYQAVTAAQGVTEKPLWDTEASWGAFGNYPTPSGSQQVGFVAKYFLLHWSLGVPRFVWYAYDGGAIWGGLWNSAKGESPAAKAYGETYRWMVGATLTSPCSANKTSGIWTCALSRPGGYSAEVVWIPNTRAAYTVPSQYTEYLDLAGTVHSITSSTVTIGDQPLLFENGALP